MKKALIRDCFLALLFVGCSAMAQFMGTNPWIELLFGGVIFVAGRFAFRNFDYLMGRLEKFYKMIENQSKEL